MWRICPLIDLGIFSLECYSVGVVHSHELNNPGIRRCLADAGRGDRKDEPSQERQVWTPCAEGDAGDELEANVDALGESEQDTKDNRPWNKELKRLRARNFMQSEEYQQIMRRGRLFVKSSSKSLRVRESSD